MINNRLILIRFEGIVIVPLICMSSQSGCNHAGLPSFAELIRNNKNDGNDEEASDYKDGDHSPCILEEPLEKRHDTDVRMEDWHETDETHLGV